MLELCGVMAYKSNRSRAGDRRVLRAAKFTMNGKPIIKNFDYFAKIASPENPDRAQANCAKTSAAIPTSEVTFDIDTPQRGYRLD